MSQFAQVSLISGVYQRSGTIESGITRREKDVMTRFQLKNTFEQGFTGVIEKPVH